MGVSKNHGTPKSSHLFIGFSTIFTIHFKGKPLLFETPILVSGTSYPFFSGDQVTMMPRRVAFDQRDSGHRDPHRPPIKPATWRTFGGSWFVRGDPVRMTGDKLVNRVISCNIH